MENEDNCLFLNEFEEKQIFDYYSFNDKQINLTDTKKRIFYLNIFDGNQINNSECTKSEPYLCNAFQVAWFFIHNIFPELDFP